MIQAIRELTTISGGNASSAFFLQIGGLIETLRLSTIKASLGKKTGKRPERLGKNIGGRPKDKVTDELIELCRWVQGAPKKRSAPELGAEYWKKRLGKTIKGEIPIWLKTEGGIKNKIKDVKRNLHLNPNYLDELIFRRDVLYALSEMSKKPGPERDWPFLKKITSDRMKVLIELSRLRAPDAVGLDDDAKEKS